MGAWVSCVVGERYSFLLSIMYKVTFFEDFQTGGVCGQFHEIDRPKK